VRKLFASILVALLALTVSLAAVGCGQRAEETSTTETQTPEPMPMDSMMSDTMAMDTTSSH